MLLSLLCYKTPKKTRHPRWSSRCPRRPSSEITSVKFSKFYFPPKAELLQRAYGLPTHEGGIFHEHKSQTEWSILSTICYAILEKWRGWIKESLPLTALGEPARDGLLFAVACCWMCCCSVCALWRFSWFTQTPGNNTDIGSSNVDCMSLRTNKAKSTIYNRNIAKKNSVNCFIKLRLYCDCNSRNRNTLAQL